MKSILDQLVGPSEPVTRFNNLTIVDILPDLKDGDSYS